MQGRRFDVRAVGMVGLEVAGISLLHRISPRLEDVSNGNVTVEEETALIQQACKQVMASNRDRPEVCTNGACARVLINIKVVL